MQLIGPEWTEDEIDALLSAADTNRDGLIQYDEFVSWLTASGDEWDEFRADLQGDDRTGDPVEIIVSDLMGPEYKIEANTAWTVSRLKQAIQAASGIPIACQDLAAAGDDVEDNELLGGPKLKGQTDFQLMDRRQMAGGDMIAAEVVVLPSAAVVAPASATEPGAVAAEEVAADAVPDTPVATPIAPKTDASKTTAEKPKEEVVFEMDLF